MAKTLYKVSDHKPTISFTDLTTLLEVRDGEDKIDVQKFRLRVFDDFAHRDIDLFGTINPYRTLEFPCSALSLTGLIMFSILQMSLDNSA